MPWPWIRRTAHCIASLGLHYGVQGQFELALAEVAKGEALGSVDFADLFRGLIHLAQGDRPGAVDSWNRHLQRRGIRTQAPQLVVEALADPRGRPAALAATDDLPADDFVFYASVLLGDADRAVRVVHDLERGTVVMDNVIWWDLARECARPRNFVGSSAPLGSRSCGGSAAGRTNAAGREPTTSSATDASAQTAERNVRIAR